MKHTRVDVSVRELIGKMKENPACASLPTHVLRAILVAGVVMSAYLQAKAFGVSREDMEFALNQIMGYVSVELEEAGVVSIDEQLAVLGVADKLLADIMRQEFAKQDARLES